MVVVSYVLHEVILPLEAIWAPVFLTIEARMSFSEVVVLLEVPFHDIVSSKYGLAFWELAAVRRVSCAPAMVVEIGIGNSVMSALMTIKTLKLVSVSRCHMLTRFPIVRESPEKLTSW